MRAEQELTFTECCACGILFGMPKVMMDERRVTLKPFFCPSGHSLSYSVSELNKLKAKLVATERERTILRERLTMEEQRRKKKKINP